MTQTCVKKRFSSEYYVICDVCEFRLVLRRVVDGEFARTSNQVPGSAMSVVAQVDHVAAVVPENRSDKQNVKIFFLNDYLVCYKFEKLSNCPPSGRTFSSSPRCQFLCEDLCYYKIDSVPGTCNTMIWDDPHTEIVL